MLSAAFMPASQAFKPLRELAVPARGASRIELADSSGRFGLVRLVPPHPYPLPQGEGTPHPALQRAEALWIGENAASDSPSPQGRAGVRGKQRSKRQCACELPMN